MSKLTAIAVLLIGLVGCSTDHREQPIELAPLREYATSHGLRYFAFYAPGASRWFVSLWPRGKWYDEDHYGSRIMQARHWECTGNDLKITVDCAVEKAKHEPPISDSPSPATIDYED